jgi:hypothetical protein
MSAANDLIERLERETGQRVDDNDGDNLAMAGLFGAISRLLGESPPTYREHDDVVAGIVIRHRMSPEYAREQDGRRLLASLLVGGISPDGAEE